MSNGRHCKRSIRRTEVVRAFAYDHLALADALLGLMSNRAEAYKLARAAGEKACLFSRERIAVQT